MSPAVGHGFRRFWPVSRRDLVDRIARATFACSSLEVRCTAAAAAVQSQLAAELPAKQPKNRSSEIAKQISTPRWINSTRRASRFRRTMHRRCTRRTGGAAVRLPSQPAAIAKTNDKPAEKTNKAETTKDRRHIDSTNAKNPTRSHAASDTKQAQLIAQSKAAARHNCQERKHDIPATSRRWSLKPSRISPSLAPPGSTNRPSAPAILDARSSRPRNYAIGRRMLPGRRHLPAAENLPTHAATRRPAVRRWTAAIAHFPQRNDISPTGNCHRTLTEIHLVRLIGSTALNRLGIGADYVRREIVAKDPKKNNESREYIDTVERSFGPMKQLLPAN